MKEALDYLKWQFLYAWKGENDEPGPYQKRLGFR